MFAFITKIPKDSTVQELYDYITRHYGSVDIIVLYRNYKKDAVAKVRFISHDEMCNFFRQARRLIITCRALTPENQLNKKHLRVGNFQTYKAKSCDFVITPDFVPEVQDYPDKLPKQKLQKII